MLRLVTALVVPVYLVICWQLSPPVEVAVEASSPPVSDSWLASVSSDIENSEYEIRYQDEAEHYQSPNREHNLRFSYFPNGFAVEPRTSAANDLDWQARFELTAIGRANATPLKPQATATIQANAEKLVYHHSDGFDMEFLNRKNGMRQNFIVAERPEGEGKLHVEMQLTSNLQPVLLHPNELILADPQANGTQTPHMRYKDLKVWDANGTECEAHMELDETTDLLALVVNDAAATYPLTIDPLTTSSEWNTESNQANAQYGISVAPAGDVNGDGFSDLMIGAYLYDNGQNNEGRVYVYHGAAGGPSTTAAIILEINQAAAYFGFSCNTAGDVNGDGYSDIIVGAYLYDNGTSNEGGAFVFHGSALGLSSTSDWSAEGGQANSKFGFSVASVGDVNGDGFSDVVVGAYDYDNGQTNEGRAFVYHGSALGLSGTADWTDESDQANASFGKGVAGAGDVNGDGFSDLIIGVQYYDNGESDEGGAMVYHGSGAGLSATPDATVESDQANATMGRSVACAGDVNGDGYSDVICSVHLYTNGQTNEGSAFVFHGSASGISTTADWTAEQDQANASFGVAVASAGDVNGDGYADVIIGAHVYDNTKTDEGGAFVYHGSSTGLSVTEDWSAFSGQASARFGLAVGSAGDVNGDGHSDILVGGPNNDQGQADEGRVFMYAGGTEGLSSTALWTSDADQDDANYGFSVNSAGDVNFDGFSDVIVGAPDYDNGQAGEGRAFVFFGSGTGPSGTADWTAEPNVAGAQFGYSVNIAGDVDGDGFSDVIVGAPGYTNGNTGEGGAFVYHGSLTGPSATADWTTEGNQNNAAYGTSVSTAGDVNGDGYHDAVVGSPTFTNGQSNEGSAFVYHGSATGLSLVNDWSGESDQADANYGIAVGTAGDVNGDGYTDLVVGANQYDNGQSNEGRAFVYHGSSGGLALAANWTNEPNQVGAGFGVALGSAGDVNGDGYSDLIVGADLYNNGQSDEGRAFTYHGSAAGLGASASWTAESNQADAHFGISVASAGDVNGDGYSDVIVGADDYDNGQTDEGGAFVYHGSSTGLNTTADWTTESDQADAHLGTSVAGAADIDGDAYSDVIIGAPDYDNGNTNEGQSITYSGNLGNNLCGFVQLLDNDESSALSSASYNDPSFGIGVFTRSPIGRARAGLFWETAPPGTGFSSGTNLANSVSSDGSDNTYTDLTLTGAKITAVVNKESVLTKVRMRVKYDPSQVLDGRVLSPWMYHQPYLRGSSGGPLPVELTEFIAHYLPAENRVALDWTTSSELNNDRFVVERGYNGTNFKPLATVKGAGTTSEVRSYVVFDNDPGSGVIYYRIRQFDLDGRSEVSAVRVVTIDLRSTVSVNLYPNPASQWTQIEAELPENSSVQVYQSNGLLQQSIVTTSTPLRLDVSEWKAGMYLVVVSTPEARVVKRLMVK